MLTKIQGNHLFFKKECNATRSLLPLDVDVAATLMNAINIFYFALNSEV